MRLQELEKHIGNQTLKINRCVNRPTCFTNFMEDEDDPSWATFRDSVWGNASALARLEKQGLSAAQNEVGMNIDVEGEGDSNTPQGIQPAVELPDTQPVVKLPNTQPVVRLPETLPDVWGLDSSHVLVRSEYEEAEEAALMANASNVDAFLVTGQPGIGPPSHSSSPSTDPNP
jgi:hypothetical protein